MSAPGSTRVPGLPELVLAPGSLCIADLHLDLAVPHATGAFVAWLAALECVPQLWILGDLFDVWVGPAQARMPGATAVLDALAARAARGTEVAIVPGNRDFLLDASFERRTQARVYRDGAIAIVGEAQAPATRVLLIHGDTLCTRDVNYQRLRRVLRSRTLTTIVPHLPLFVGAWAARRLRRASVNALQYKLPEEKSMQASACRELARASAADAVVCGHAHEFRDELLQNGPRWLVLDAFGGAHDLVRVDARGLLVPASSGSSYTPHA